MADENTTNYSFTKPEVGASEDSWGDKLNANWDSVDSLLSGNTDLSSLSISGDLTVDTDTLYVDSSNNRVGIGTSSPTFPLDVADGTNKFQFIPSSLQLRTEGGDSTLDSSDGGWIFETSNTEVMRIDGSGNVGIGTSNPQGALHVGPGEFHTEARRVEARAIIVSDTSSYTNVLTIGNRATYHILIGGSDASSGSNGLAIIEAYAVCSNDVEVEIAPNTIHNSSTRGIDVQWSGSTLQVKPRDSASNMWGVRVEVLGHYTASSVSDITWHL
jgi:hypothetical protein